MENRREFKIGDVVQLKSGGPSMTIGFCDGQNLFICEWITSDGQSRQHTFAKEMLKLFKPEQKIRLWKLGNSDKQILPTKAAVEKLLKVLGKGLDEENVLDIVWDDMIKCEVVASGECHLVGDDRKEVYWREITEDTGDGCLHLTVSGKAKSGKTALLNVIIKHLKDVGYEII